MVELRIRKRDSEVSRYSFGSGTITIGRNPDNEVCLNSPSVSPQHARLSLSKGICSIENLTAQGGTFVNNLEVNRAQLYNKDVIRIGHYSIVLCIDREQQPAAVEQDPAAPGAGSSPQSQGREVERLTPAAPDHATNSGPADAETAAPTATEEVVKATQIEQTRTPDFSTTGVSAPPAISEQMEPAPEQNGPAEPDQPSAGSALPVDQTDRIEQEESAAPAAVSNSLPPLHGTGIDVLSGPAEGKRIYFTRDRAALGVRDATAVVIKTVPEGYVAAAPNADIKVTLNGDLITPTAVPLDDGDLIVFGHLKARFFVDAPSD